MSRRTTATATLALLGALLLTASGCSSDEPPRSPVGPPVATKGEAPAPTGGSPFWVDPDSDAAQQVRRYEAQGRTDDARVLKRISEQPVADWPAGDDPVPEIRRAVGGATAENRTAVFVAYNIPHRDCGMYSAGGAHDAQAYRAWVDSFASAIGDASAVVVLEPDAVPHMVDGCTPGQYHEERSALLAEAIERLKRQPGTRVYLDAGNPAWIDDPGKLVEPLRRAGIGRADGFSLNVSNFQTTATVRDFGATLSGLLGGMHFTVDTSRNGAGQGRPEVPHRRRRLEVRHVQREAVRPADPR
ncbi:glycoside hydrolase family 6 protein, partial [Streptomyces hydrogenans]